MQPEFRHGLLNACSGGRRRCRPPVRQDCYYVDKTAFIERLLRGGTHYFLSRPRRFGKSLFLDTLKELFEGNEALFAGLYIHDRHDWSERHPMVRLSFGSGSFTEPATLHEDVAFQLEDLEEAAGIASHDGGASPRLRRLLRTLHRQTGQRVVVLVDEYDKPILDALEAPEVARANRDYLRGLYGVIKDSDAHVRFTFLTGISKFSKVNLFSQLNNRGPDRHAGVAVPDRLPDSNGEEELGGKALYRLGYPNREVRQSLNEHLLRHLVQDVEQQTANSMRLQRLLATHDCAGLQELFHAFFASIPYERHAARRCRRTNNDIAQYEGYYASVFYSYFAALGYEIAVEESSSHGRLDMAVRTGGHVYLFEFKVAELAAAGSALAQLRERGYADKYRGRGEPIHLIGVELSRQTRNVTAFELADG